MFPDASEELMGADDRRATGRTFQRWKRDVKKVKLWFSEYRTWNLGVKDSFGSFDNGIFNRRSDDALMIQVLLNFNHPVFSGLY